MKKWHYPLIVFFFLGLYVWEMGFTSATLGTTVIDGYLLFYGLTFLLAVAFLGRPPDLKSVKSNLKWLGFFDRAGSRSFRIVCLLSLFSFFLWTLVFIAKHHSFHTGIVDSGVYSNIVSNSSHGRWFYSSHYYINALGEHFSPITLVFVPLFWIHPSLLWLLTAQAAAVTVCPVILYFIAREVIKDEKLADRVSLIAAILWLAFPSLINALNAGFHPSTLAPPFILFAFLSLVRNRMGWFWTVMVFLLLFKENLALVWVGFGLYAFLVLKRKRLGMALVVLGGIWGIAVVKWVIPYFRGFAWAHPQRIGPVDFIGLKVKYLLVYLLLPLGFLSLVHWRASLLTLPPVLLNLSVKYQAQFSGHYQYDDVIVPLLFISALHGIVKLKDLAVSRKIVKVSARYAFVWLLIPLGFSLFYPLGHLAWYFPDKTRLAVMDELDRVKRQWPDQKIHFQYALGTHLNLRRQVDVLKGDWKSWSFEKGELIVLAPVLKKYNVSDYFKIDDYPSALEHFEKNKNSKYGRVDESFHFLYVYEVL